MTQDPTQRSHCCATVLVLRTRANSSGATDSTNPRPVVPVEIRIEDMRTGSVNLLAAQDTDAHLLALRQEAPGSVWMVAGLDFDILPHVAAVVGRGGGVRTGLEDAPFGTERSNEELTVALLEAVREVGGEIATAEHVRAELRKRRAGVLA